MLLYEEIIFLHNCNYSKLKCICNEMNQDSWNGATNINDLICHIINHYRLYELSTHEAILTDAIRCKCSKRLQRIDEIIHEHMMLAGADEKKPR